MAWSLMAPYACNIINFVLQKLVCKFSILAITFLQQLSHWFTHTGPCFLPYKEIGYYVKGGGTEKFQYKAKILSKDMAKYLMTITKLQNFLKQQYYSTCTCCV